MGTCRYCGKDCGWFSRKHNECEEKHTLGINEFGNVANNYFSGRATSSDVKRCISINRRDNYLTDDDIANVSDAAIRNYTVSIHRPFSPTSMILMDEYLNAVGVNYSIINRNGSVDEFTKKLLRGFMVEYFTDKLTLPIAHGRCEKILSKFPMAQSCIEDAYLYVLNKAATNFLKNGIITDDEQQKIDEYVSYLSLPLTNLPVRYQNADISKLGQVAILKNIQSGIIPRSNALVPIVLAKDESILWTYGGVSLYEEKITREWVGKHRGLTIRVMKGVYYRTGGSKGRPVEHSSMELQGTGSLYVTNKNLIFTSPSKGVKIPYAKIVGLTPYSDGIEIHKDGANQKRMTMQGFDPWFLMNLLSIIPNL